MHDLRRLALSLYGGPLPLLPIRELAKDQNEAASVKEYPIIFSGPMVRAILDGRKTQTRRVMKPQPGDHPNDDGFISTILDRCPYGKPGDRLWVRETFYIDMMPWDVMRLPKQRPDNLNDLDIYYRADGECCQQIPECSCGEIGKPRWRPSIHMNRWVSRIMLELVEVRVERLQGITEEDAIAEGVDAVSMEDAPRQATWSRRQDFAQLWDRLNRKRAPWDSNPWVWVLSFRRLP